MELFIFPIRMSQRSYRYKAEDRVSYTATMSQFLSILLVCLAVLAASSARIQKRVVNGDVAAHVQFPYMVSVRTTASSGHSCGGCIVTPEHVVTAAHCIADHESVPYPAEAYFVVTGHLNNIEGGRDTGVSEVRMHPEYAPFDFWRNDIAVLKLATPIPYTATEQPIPIASADPGVQTCILSGWGRTHFPSMGVPSQLQWVIQNTMTRETCIESYPEEIIFDSTLCAFTERGKGVCSGDSGGPLVCNGELAGVVSWGNACANGTPDGYARVFYYRDWLLENTDDLSTLGQAYAAEALAARKASEQ